MELKPKIIVIVGPTSSGKSDLAVEIAKRFKGEVISADSRQVYKGLDIGSGKVPKDKKIPKSYTLNTYYSLNYLSEEESSSGGRFYFYKGTPHHLLSVASPKSIFTVAKYKILAQKAIKEILDRGKLPIICGGTGFYVDSLIYDWKIPEVPPQLELRKRLAKKSAAELFKKLSVLDPERAKTIDRNNKVRLMRALEIVITSGVPVPLLKAQNNSPYNFLKIGIKIEPGELKARIKKRLFKRLKTGLVREVKNLHLNGLTWKRLDEFGLEYRYVSRYIRSMMSYKEMIEAIEQESFRYAKRQMTWFSSKGGSSFGGNRDENTIWINDSQKAFSFVLDFLGRAVQP